MKKIERKELAQAKVAGGCHKSRSCNPCTPPAPKPCNPCGNCCTTTTL